MSVDGLRPEMLAGELLNDHPSMGRLLRGAHTLDARTDPDVTVTLPNHVGMATGRLFAGPAGHNWLGNGDPPAPGSGGTLAEMHGAYVPSMFDVAHDAGATTALIASKPKFVLFENSYNAQYGAADVTGSDQGRDKIDRCTITPDCEDVARQALAFLRVAATQEKRSLSFVHFSEADAAGHAKGWDLADASAYRQAVRRIDRAIGAILASIDSEALLRGHVAIILTTDHGGGDPPLTHTNKNSPLNFTIPFAVWVGADEDARDLYELNAKLRTRPSAASNPTATESAPIRSADAANVALMILGFEAVPDSCVNARQDLEVAPEAGTTVR